MIQKEIRYQQRRPHVLKMKSEGDVRVCAGQDGVVEGGAGQAVDKLAGR